MYFTAQEVLLGGKERGRSGKSSYQLHIAYEPRQDPLSRHIPKLLHVQLPSHRASKLLLLPYCWCTTAALMICVSGQSSCPEKCKGQFVWVLRYTSLVRRPRAEEAICCMSSSAPSLQLAGDGRWTFSFCHCFSHQSSKRDIARPPLSLPTAQDKLHRDGWTAACWSNWWKTVFFLKYLFNFCFGICCKKECIFCGLSINCTLSLAIFK